MGITFLKDSIAYPKGNMNKKIEILLIALVMMDIIDGDFKVISILDGVKIVLYIICFALLVRNGRDDKA